METGKSFIKKLKAYDLVVVVFYVFLIIMNIIFYSKIDYTATWLLVNTAVIAFAFLISFLEDKQKLKLWRIIHYWYIAPLIFLTFKQIYFMIKPIRGVDYDWLFIKIDYWIFGANPTQVLEKIAFPLLTEILQVIYSIFYLLPIILALVLLRKKKYLALDFAIFSVVYGFFLSYLGYFALPGIGPRFTLHNFSELDIKLPGLFLTKYLREFVNLGESIPGSTANPAEFVQRDVFPSGHTMITLIVMYLSVRLKSRSRYFFLPVGSLLIFATVYLQYHYVIDLAGGLIFMIISVWSGKYLFNWWRRKTGREEFQYNKIQYD
ncbi:MAG TPA: phosphatase PAP2 family protein [Ignavibacteriaceae bacterium]